VRHSGRRVDEISLELVKERVVWGGVNRRIFKAVPPTVLLFRRFLVHKAAPSEARLCAFLMEQGGGERAK